MENYDEGTYGERIAEVYDAVYGHYEEATISTLVELAGNRQALELGIGTGRIAIPLAKQGVDVRGIDASPGMIARMRGKPGGEAIPVTMGNFAAVEVEGPFTLIYVVINTFFSLTSQEAQVKCFQNAARRLTSDGVFVIEAFVPDVTRFTHGQCTVASVIDVDRVGLDVSHHDPVGQKTIHQHVSFTEHGIRFYPLELRYAWPTELDLMARLAGLRLRCRHGGWQKEPFTAASQKHVSVYERDPAPVRPGD